MGNSEVAACCVDRGTYRAVQTEPNGGAADPVDGKGFEMFFNEPDAQ